MDCIKLIGEVISLIVLVNTFRQVRKLRRLCRLRDYIHKVHQQPANLGETIGHFWLGSMYARYGTDRQLDDWYAIMHGTTLGLDADIAELR